MKKTVLTALAAALAGSAAAATFDTPSSTAPISGISTSTSTLPSSTPAETAVWTEIRGEVVEVNKSKNSVKVRETGTGTLRDVSVTPSVTIENNGQTGAELKSLKKGQTVILRNDASIPEPLAQ